MDVEFAATLFPDVEFVAEASVPGVFSPVVVVAVEFAAARLSGTWHDLTPSLKAAVSHLPHSSDQ